MVLISKFKTYKLLPTTYEFTAINIQGLQLILRKSVLTNSTIVFHAVFLTSKY